MTIRGLPSPACGQAFPVAESLCGVVSNEAVNAEYRLLTVRAPPVALAAQPGQFFHLLCPATGEDRPFLRRPMSIYGVDSRNATLAFLYKVQGAGTRGLASLMPGNRLNALGPLGRGFTLPAGARHVLLVARGVGLATLRPLAGHAVAGGAKVTALLSARTPELMMSDAALRAAGARTILVSDHDGSSDVAAVRAVVTALHEAARIDYVATCGSNRLLALVQTLAGAWGIPGEIALEQHMGCALGMCFACVRGFSTANGEQDYRRVCWDGPVFDVMEAQPWST